MSDGVFTCSDCGGSEPTEQGVVVFFGMPDGSVQSKPVCGPCGEDYPDGAAGSE